jgi:tetratricopeptide (TPR) repeat protein
MLGVALAVGWGLCERWSKPLVAGGAAVILLLGIRSSVQALTWQNRRTLYGHAVAISPQSASAHSNWGIVLSNAGDDVGAEAEYRRAIQIDPDFLAAHYNLAGILRAQNRLDELEQERKIVERIKEKQVAATQPAS